MESVLGVEGRGANLQRAPREGALQVEGGSDEALSGLSHGSFWPALGLLCTMLASNGFSEVPLLQNDLQHANQPPITFATFDR